MVNKLKITSDNYDVLKEYDKHISKNRNKTGRIISATITGEKVLIIKKDGNLEIQEKIKFSWSKALVWFSQWRAIVSTPNDLGKILLRLEPVVISKDGILDKRVAGDKREILSAAGGEKQMDRYDDLSITFEKLDPSNKIKKQLGEARTNLTMYKYQYESVISEQADAFQENLGKWRHQEHNKQVASGA